MSTILKVLAGLAFVGSACVGVQAAEASNAAAPQFKWVRSLNASNSTEPVVVTVVSTPAQSTPLPPAPAASVAQAPLPSLDSASQALAPAASVPQVSIPTPASPSLPSTPVVSAPQPTVPTPASPTLPSTPVVSAPQPTAPTPASPTLPSTPVVSAPQATAPALASASLPGAPLSSATQESAIQTMAPAPVSPAPQGTKDTILQRKDLSPQKWAILLSDKTLYRTLRRWSQEAQYQLLWQVDRDYPIEAEIVFDNTLREAVAQVMGGVALTDYPLQAIFNPSTRVLRVVRHMDEGAR